MTDLTTLDIVALAEAFVLLVCVGLYLLHVVTEGSTKDD